MVGRSKLLPALPVVFIFCEYETRLSRCLSLLFRRCHTFFYDLDTRYHVPVSPTSRTWCDHDPFLRSGLPAASVEFLFEYIFHIFSYYNECWLVTSITAFCNQVRRRFTTFWQQRSFFWLKKIKARKKRKKRKMRLNIFWNFIFQLSAELVLHKRILVFARHVALGVLAWLTFLFF